MTHADPIYDAILSTRRKLNPREGAVPTLNIKEPAMNSTTETPKEQRPAVAKGAYKSKAHASKSIPDKDLPPRQRLHQSPSETMKSPIAKDGTPKIKASVALAHKAKAEHADKVATAKAERKPEHGRQARADYEEAKAVSPGDIAKHMKLTPKAVRTVLRRCEAKIPAALRVKGPRWGFTNIDSITAFLREHIEG